MQYKSEHQIKVASFFLLACLSFSLFAQSDKKHILVLNSYHQGFHWTDRITEGIKSVLGEQDNIDYYINYMDTKRLSTPAYFKQLRDIYAAKYKQEKFDVIITSDDHALDFLLQYRDELFPDTPVIFSGLNAFPPDRLKGKDGFTGVFESYDVSGTIELMLRLHPETEVITTITDGTRSGDIFKSLIINAQTQFSDRVEFNLLHNVSRQEIQKSLRSLPENSLVLWAIYIRTPAGITLTSEESVKFVADNSRFPTYCVWDVVGQGVVGGKITDPKYQGETSAKIALRVLSGEAVTTIPVLGSPLENIFDYRALEKFAIQESALPSDSIVLNKPVSFYETFKVYIWLFFAILILLIVVIVFLIAVILMKRNTLKLQGLAMHDQLTGLYNRHYLVEVARSKMAEAIRHQWSLCLLVLDLDLFKSINDKHGHLVGDKVLEKLASLLSEHNRAEDIVARFGGEEFVLLLSQCNADQATHKAEQIKQEIELLNPNNISITASIGIAELDPQKDSFESLMDRADKAVYKAKEAGRNCVVFIQA